MPETLSIPCNGWIVSLLPLVLTFTASILAAMGTRSCRFLNTQNEVSARSFVGIFFYQGRSADDPCLNANFMMDMVRDSVSGELSEDWALSEDAFQISQIGALLGTSVGFVVTSILLTSMFRPLPTRLFRCGIPLLLILASVGCGMTFRLFDIYWCGGKGETLDEDTGELVTIDGECYLQEGGIRMAVALGLYVVTAMLMSFVMELPTHALLSFSRSNHYEAVLITREQDGEGPAQQEDSSEGVRATSVGNSSKLETIAQSDTEAPTSE